MCSFGDAKVVPCSFALGAQALKARKLLDALHEVATQAHLARLGMDEWTESKIVKVCLSVSVFVVLVLVRNIASMHLRPESDFRSLLSTT